MQAGRRPIVWGLIGTAGMLLGFFLFVLALAALLTGEAGVTDSGMKIAVVRIEGVISSDVAQRTVEQLTKYREDSSIGAVILRIDSPGGGVASSQEIYGEVERLRSDGKLVVASLGSLAASGGYYIACGVERIFANPGTITGSIGVLVQLANAEELLQKLGIEATVITSGPLKALGNPTQPLRPEAREVFQTLVDDVHQQFVAAVAQGRHMPYEEVRQHADGRIFTGRQAQEFRLVDELGTLQDAVSYAAATLGISGKPKLVQEERERFWWLKFVLENALGLTPLQAFPPVHSVLQYRWLY
jgi:protease IV